MTTIPKYINKKLDKLNNLIDEADLLKAEIESWAESKGIDTYSEEWYTAVIDESNSVSSIYKDGLIHFIENYSSKRSN